jgi:soluble lytic murein transglycosylase-like protein
MENNQKQKIKIEYNSERNRSEMKQKIIIAILASVLSYFIATEIYQYYEYNKIDKEFNSLSRQYSWLTRKIYKINKEEARDQEVPERWMLAIYHSESRGNPYAVSSAGAMGLGQIMPFHYRGRKEALFDIDLNIHLSVFVFKGCLDQNKGDLVRALNAYEGSNNRPAVNVKYLSEIIYNIYFYREK